MCKETPDDVPQSPPRQGGPGTARLLPEIVLIYCRQVAADGIGGASPFESADGFTVRPVLVPCGAKVEIPHLLRILEDGADGVEVVTCPEGKCRSLVGNVLAEKRIGRARLLLDQARLGADRLNLSRGEGLSAGELLRRAGARAAAVAPLGPNPMKAPGAGRGRDP